MSFIGRSETSSPEYPRCLTETCRRVCFTARVVEDIEFETSEHQIGRSGNEYQRGWAPLLKV
jgi:hypothetical protein